MKSTLRYILLIVVFYSAFCEAEPSAARKDEANNSIEMKKASKNGLTVVLFSRGGTNFYRLVFKDVIYSRTFAPGITTIFDLRVTEHDLDMDGKLDAIQIGKDDHNFSAYIVLIEDGKMDIEPLPDNWKDGSEYPYDTFMNYVKKRKGIK